MARPRRGAARFGWCAPALSIGPAGTAPPTPPSRCPPATRWSRLRYLPAFGTAPWPDPSDREPSVQDTTEAWQSWAAEHTSYDGAFPAEVRRSSLVLLALRLNGENLHIDHGYPVRLIAPNRPGVMQTKWLRQVEPT